MTPGQGGGGSFGARHTLGPRYVGRRSSAIGKQSSGTCSPHADHARPHCTHDVHNSLLARSPFHGPILPQTRPVDRFGLKPRTCYRTAGGQVAGWRGRTPKSVRQDAGPDVAQGLAPVRGSALGGRFVGRRRHRGWRHGARAANHAVAGRHTPCCYCGGASRAASCRLHLARRRRHPATWTGNGEVELSCIQEAAPSNLEPRRHTRGSAVARGRRSGRIPGWVRLSPGWTQG